MRQIRWTLVTLALLLVFTVTGAAASADGAVLRLPDEVTDIGAEAFAGDTSLQGVILPRDLCSVGPRAFADSSASWVYFPGTVPEGGIAEDAFENVPLELVITPWDSNAGHWAEEQGIRVAWDNDLDVRPWGDEWWIYVPYGETRHIGLDWHAEYDEDLQFAWFRVETGKDGEDVWKPIAGADEPELTTDPVVTHTRYGFRVTDTFGFRREGWFDVMVDNHQEIWPEGLDHIGVPEGQSAELRVAASADDESVMDFQWYRIDWDEYGIDSWVELEGKTGPSFVTDPVTGPVRYACRLTDTYGSMADCWFLLDIDAEENAAAAGKATEITATKAVIPITYSVTNAVAERGYRMGVYYSTDKSALNPDENGRVNTSEWTWGGESGVYGARRNEKHYGWLDELIPGRTYYYRACIRTDDGELVALGSTIRSFTTKSASGVTKLTLNKHAALSAGDQKNAYRFTLPEDGFYALCADNMVSEMSVRRADDAEIAHNWDTDRLSFVGNAGETVYLFACNFDYDAQVWVESAGAIPTEDVVASGEANDVTATTAWIALEYTTAEDSANAGYIPGLAFSRDPEALLNLNDRGELDCQMWDCWAYEDASHRVVLEERESKLIDELVPDTVYYYRAYLRVCDGSFRYEPAESAEDLKSFTTGSGRTVPALTESENGANWREFPREEKAAFRFTAPWGGIYGVQADRTISELKIYNANGDWLTGEDWTGMQFFSAHTGETVYIFARNWEESAMISLFFAADFPEDNAISSDLRYIDSTVADLSVRFDVNEETAERGYFVGVAYSAYPERLEQLNNNGRFDCDMWNWDWMNQEANGAELFRRIDQLTPDRTFYFRPYILSDNQVVCFGDMVEGHTADAGNEVQAILPGGTLDFSGDAVTPALLTAEIPGMYSLSVEPSFSQADVRRADGTHITNARDHESVLVYLDPDEPVYLYLRNWDGSGTAYLSSEYIPAPTEDTIDARIAQDPEGVWRMGIRGSVTPETAAGGYGYRMEFSSFPDFADEAGNPRATILFRQNGEGRIRIDEADVRPLPPLVPGMHIYYRGVLNRFGSTELFSETKEFTVPDREVPVIGVSASWTRLEANTPALYRFTAGEAGFFGIEGENVNDLGVVREDGSGMRAINQIEHDKRTGFLVVGFEKGDTIYIRAAGGEGARIRVIPEGERGITLGKDLQWVWDNRLTRFVADKAGSYTVTVNDPALAQNVVLCRGAGGSEIERLRFNGDSTTVSLNANEKVHFIAWYDMVPGQELYMSVAPTA